MPAQQGLGAYQERPPGRATENPAQGGEDQAIGRLEAAPANLAFKHAELVAERENLDLQRGVCIPAEDDSVEQGPDRARGCLVIEGRHVRHPRPIGSAGTSARIIVGAVLLGIVLQGELSTGGLSPPSLAFGLVGLPALVLAWQWLGARRIPARLEATKPWDFALNMALVAALYFTRLYAPPLAFTGDATLYFYGGSMLLAAWRGFDGCEVQAVSNWLMGRDHHVGCAVFAPVDYLERRWGRRRAAKR